MDSATLRSKQMAIYRKNNNLPVYDGGLGESPMPLPKILHDAVINNATDKYYKPVTGIKDLESALLNKYNADSVIVGNGLKELLFIAQLAFDGVIILISPYWVSYKTHCDILNKKYYIFDTTSINDYKINVDMFDDFLEKIEGNKLLIFNNPCNPTGIIYEEESIKNLATVCQKHNLIVLEDEIYIDLVHLGHETCSISKYYNNVIHGNSISKQYGCGGYRLGWLVFPKELKDYSNKIASYSSSIYSCASSPMHHVALKAITTPSLNIFINNTRKLFTELADIIDIILNNNSQIKHSKMMSAWYTILDFSNYREVLTCQDIKTSDELQCFLTNEIGFITVSGSSFGLPNSDLCVRYSYVDLDNDDLGFDKIKEGLYKLCQLLESLTKN